MCARLDSSGKQRHRFIPGPVWSSTRSSSRVSSKDLAKLAVSVKGVNRGARLGLLLEWPLSQVDPFPDGLCPRIIQLFALNLPSTRCLYSRCRGSQLSVFPHPRHLVVPFPLATHLLHRVCTQLKYRARRPQSQSMMSLLWYDLFSVALTRSPRSRWRSHQSPKIHQSRGPAVVRLANVRIMYYTLLAILTA